VLHITDTVHLCKEDTLEHIEQLLHTLLKTADSRTLMAAGNIISCLVHNVLTIDERMQRQCSLAARAFIILFFLEADTSGGPPATGGEQAHTRLLACLSTLYLFSRTRPELLVSHAETLLPYLMLSAGSSGGGEQLVLVQVVNILERVIPLIDHPSESFVHRLENDLLNLCRRGTMVWCARLLPFIGFCSKLCVPRSRVYQRWLICNIDK
jgi:cohesin loading factor subunit SCC2